MFNNDSGNAYYGGSNVDGTILNAVRFWIVVVDSWLWETELGFLFCKLFIIFIYYMHFLIIILKEIREHHYH